MRVRTTNRHVVLELKPKEAQTLAHVVGNATQGGLYKDQAKSGASRGELRAIRSVRHIEQQILKATQKICT